MIPLPSNCSLISIQNADILNLTKKKMILESMYEILTTGKTLDLTA